MIGTVEWTPDLGSGAPVVGRVYGFRSRNDGEFRYVGQTTKSIRRRRGEHRRQALAGRKTPFYDWLRKVSPDDYEVVELEAVTESREALGEAEESWITLFRVAGDRLLNLTDGGLGPKGVSWTEERRAAARKRNSGRKGVSLPGELNPMWGRRHSDEQKARWSVERKGRNTGSDNPNFGKFGAEHPAFGREVSEETRQLLSEQKKGSRNPNFGRRASAETRARMSAVRSGRSMPSSVRSAHTRHHTNKGVFRESCKHCLDDAKAQTTMDQQD